MAAKVLTPQTILLRSIHPQTTLRLGFHILFFETGFAFLNTADFIFYMMQILIPIFVKLVSVLMISTCL